MDKKTKAKAIKIETLYDGELKQISGVLRGACPFHHDTGTPNFTIYPKTNTWYCFRCGVGGDSIKFYQMKHECDFKTALEVLGK